MRNLAERTQPAFPVTIYYAFKQSETVDDEGTSSTGWETFLGAVLDAGFALTGTCALCVLNGRSALHRHWHQRTRLLVLCSVVPTTRSRGAGSVGRKDFARQLGRALPSGAGRDDRRPHRRHRPRRPRAGCHRPRHGHLLQVQGPSLQADGSSMSVHNALIHINKTVDNYFAEGEGDLDADTRFCIAWFQQYGFEIGPFGEADVLARAKGTAVDGVRDAGVLHSAKSKVRLLKAKGVPQELGPDDGRPHPDLGGVPPDEPRPRRSRAKVTRAPSWRACRTSRTRSASSPTASIPSASAEALGRGRRRGSYNEKLVTSLAGHRRGNPARPATRAPSST